MKKINLLGAVIAIAIAMVPGALNAQSIIPPGFKQVGLINFSNWSAGNWYTLDMMANDWNPRLRNGDGVIDFKGVIHNRAVVVENPSLGGNTLRVFLPKGKILPLETGAQIFGYVGGQEELFFGVSLYLPPDFEFGKETKIPPGIYGGWAWASGGKISDGVSIGPSIRAVLQYGQAKSYIYHLNQNGNNDDGGYYRNPVYGDKFAWKHIDGKPVIFTKGAKHDIVFYARMNTPGKKDGMHQVWYNGELVLSLNDLEFRKVPTLQFDTVGVEIFHGGNNQTYATKKDNTMDIGNCEVWVRN